MPQSRLPSLNALKTFEAAARLGSFTLAADALHVTQSAVSRMVASLEAELRRPLFQRQGPRLILTPAGAEYQRAIAAALADLDAATQRLRFGDEAGPIAVSTLHTLAFRWLVPRLQRFEAAHPGLSVDLSTGDRLVDFATEPVDIAIRYGYGDWPGCRAEFLMPETVSLYCAPNFITRFGPLDRLEDLRHHRRLFHSTRPQAWPDFCAAVGLSNEAVASPSNAPAFEHFFMIIEAAVAGMGVALLPEFLVEADVATGRLIQPLPVRVQNPRAYYLAYGKGAQHRSKVAVFREWLQGEAAPYRV
ncbi:MAG: transcriptional regulator GcvA [Elstera sp.]